MNVTNFERLVTKSITIISTIICIGSVEFSEEHYWMGGLISGQNTFPNFPKARYATYDTYQ